MCKKKSVFRWKIYFLVVILSLPLLFGSVVFLIPSQYDETYLGELKRKWERLKNTEGEKLIIVGGSSVSFGIRSDLMEEQLRMPVVNWGLYAPLGSRTMLEACFDEIGKGDIVVFSPEQNPQTLSFSFQAENVWQAIDGSYSLLGELRESEMKELLGALPKFAVSKLRYVLSGKPKISGIYQRASFNEYGDISDTGRKGNQMEDGYDATHLIDFSFFPEEEFVEYLNEYAARIQKRGAKFYYRLCPMNEQAVMNEKKAEEWFLRLEKSADFTILGNPFQSIMESGWFFDTNFHLNASGAVVNTYYFVRDMKAQLKDSTVTDIELPEMPEILTEAMEKGDNSDGAYFLYEESGEDLIIIGVNEKGADRQELVFPQEYDGRRVIAVQADSLKACTKLRSVKVYGGITLYDGCFGGCRTLQQIVLVGKPGEITVGRNLLQGSGALLYTKDEDEYHLDYSWGLYSDKIKRYYE